MTKEEKAGIDVLLQSPWGFWTDDNLIFVVIDRETGHRYEIYLDGHVEGFPDNSIIMSKIPALLREAKLNGRT